MQFLRANTQVKVVVGPVVAVANGYVPVTTLDVSTADEAELMKHDAAAVVDIAAATFAAISSADGYYNLTLTTSHTDTEGLLTVLVNDDSLCLPVKQTFMVLSEAAWDSMFVAKDDGFMDVNIKTIGRADTQETEASNLESACAAYSATRGLSGTALPAAAADAAGGLPISDAGGLDLDAKIGALTFTVANKVDANSTHWGGTAVGSTEVRANLINIAGAAVSTSTAQLGVNAVNVGGTAQTGADIGSLVAKFTGITLLAQWLGLIAGKQTGNSTARTELNATGAGSGTYDETTDSNQALRDRGDAAWTTATGFSTHSAADVTGGTTVAAAVTSIKGADSDTLKTLSDQLDGVAADLPQRITKNTALSAFEFTMVSSSDHVTGATGLTVTATRSLDGAAFGACANSVSEVSNGVYKIDLAAGDLNGNTVTLKFAAATADTRIIHLVTQPT